MRKYKILLIDDIVENLQTMISFFEAEFPYYELFQVNHSEKALPIIKRIEPDLIITDWYMPGMDGIELLNQLKNDKETKDIPVIIATGVNLSSDNLNKALEAGAVDYLRKPFDRIEFKARTRSALLISEMHRQRMLSKNKELTESNLLLIKNNEFSIDLLKQLNMILRSFPENHRLISMVGEIIENIESKIKEDTWQKFNVNFDYVNTRYIERLLKVYPNLTKAELRLCSFVRLGLTNKEIASILYNSTESIKVSRSRLRKKLQLDVNDNLEAHLASI